MMVAIQNHRLHSVSRFGLSNKARDFPLRLSLPANGQNSMPGVKLESAQLALLLTVHHSASDKTHTSCYFCV